MWQQRLMPSFLSLWFNHLTGMLAVALAREHSDAVILEIDRHTLTLLSRSSGKTTRNSQASADNAGIQQLARFITMRGEVRRPLLLRLPPSQVLLKQLSLPIAARRDIEEIIGFAVDRETPFARDEIYWSYVTRRADAARGQVEVDFFLVPRNSIDPLVAAARDAGLDPFGIEVDVGPDATALIPLDTEKRAPWVRSQGPLAPLAAAACILAIIAVAIPFIRQHSALASTDAMIASLTEAAREATVLRRTADQLAKVVASLKKERGRNGSAIATLAAATKSLPDETYLTALSLRAGRLTMRGLSPSAAQLIGLLARTPAFHEPAFDAPVVESEPTGLEAFTITVNVAADAGS
jgi:general secretion pathway protein L